MAVVKGTEAIANPLQESALNKKALCDYVINVASGCLHGCTFCYVPSTPVIRARQSHLVEKGVANPQMNWGQYLFIREEVPEKLEKKLSRKKAWREMASGRGVVLLCSGTDPYQNKQTANVTRRTVEVLLKYDKRVRILTRSPLWIEDIDILNHPNVTVGMSIPFMDDELSKCIEPHSPPPSERYKALLEGYKHECRLYIAVAPTPPQLTFKDFVECLGRLMDVEPEVIFWEQINARGSNGQRMKSAGLDFVDLVMEKNSWAKHFIRQWGEIEDAADKLGCIEQLHIWPDSELTNFVDKSLLEYWWHRPSVEKWENLKDTSSEKNQFNRPYLKNHTQLSLLENYERER
jgi:DNA repair photolyase